MSTAPVFAPVDKTREVRLGLVMYGGVSLAIYINGVAHELFRTVRGRGVYRLIKRLTRSDITVDVLSGTSAGGINGVFLAYALCNEVEFAECAALWRKHGDIDKLLRQIDAPADEFTSLLDSEGFYQPRLVEAFEAMAGKPCVNPSAAPEDRTPEEATEFRELDLMVTGTDFNGRVYETVDDRGEVVQIKDHRTLFWLKHRTGRKHPFAPGALPRDAPRTKGHEPGAAAGSRKNDAVPDTHEALAKLARITSCFPAAFAPVTVTAKGEGADARLRHWGALDDENDRVFIDGGVLDNKPFTSTLDVIYHRTANRQVARRLLYVEPDPERFETNAEPVVPNLVRAALDSLTRLPGYESIANDIQSLMDHNDQVARLNTIAQMAEAAGASTRASPGGKPTPSEELYRRARLSGLSDGVLGELFQRSRDGDSRAALSELRKWFQETWVKPEGGGEELLETFDVDFRLRRLFALSYDCETALLKMGPLMRTLNNQIQVLEMIRSAMQGAVAGVVREVSRDGEEKWDAQATWEAVGRAVSRVLAVAPPEEYAEPDPAAVLLGEKTREALKARLDAAISPAVGAAVSAAAVPAGVAVSAPTPQLTLLGAADDFIKSLLAAAKKGVALKDPSLADQLIASDGGFRGRDQLLYPLEVVSGIHEKDVIRTVRISPRDAQDGLSARALEKKVTGVNLGHFAAFFKRSWRSNDILWGRLDSACELVDTLLDAEWVWTLINRNEWAPPELRELEHYLPHLAAADRAALATALEGLAGETDQKAVEAQLRDVKRLLIDAAHAEILVEGLPQVIEDAAEEQMVWNEYNRRTIEGPRGHQGNASRFVAGSDVLDPAVISEASAEIAKASIRKMAAEMPPTTLVAQFKKKYGVGEETLDDIPRVVLLDILARALLVVRNSLLQAAGPRAQALTGSLIYKAFLDWPLRVLAALAGGLRSAPSARRGAIVGTLLYTALSAVVVYKTRLDFGKLGDLGTGLFVGLPVLLLGMSSFLMSFRNGDSLLEVAGRVLWTAVRVACLVAVVGTLLVLWRTPSGELCGSALGALFGAGVICREWLAAMMTVGKLLVIVGVLLAPFAAVVGWCKRLVSRRMAKRAATMNEAALAAQAQARAST